MQLQNSLFEIGILFLDGNWRCRCLCAPKKDLRRMTGATLEIFRNPWTFLEYQFDNRTMDKKITNGLDLLVYFEFITRKSSLSKKHIVIWLASRVGDTPHICFWQVITQPKGETLDTKCTLQRSNSERNWGVTIRVTPGWWNKDSSIGGGNPFPTNITGVYLRAFPQGKYGLWWF